MSLLLKVFDFRSRVSRENFRYDPFGFAGKKHRGEPSVRPSKLGLDVRDRDVQRVLGQFVKV
jgi:hypothetical protein